MKTKLIENMPHDEYLKHPCYGASDIIKMSRSFAYWKYRRDNPEPKSRPLVIGSATHLMLEDVVRGKAVKIAPPGVLIYKEGSSLTKGFKQFQVDHPTEYCLDEDEFNLCYRMITALIEEPEVMEYLKGALIEPTIIGHFPDTEVPCKIRPDYLHLEKGLSINIKTTTDASESGFIYSSRDYQYDFQSAFYCAMLSEHYNKSFDEVHILVEKTDDGEPIPIKIFTFGPETLSWARFQMEQIIKKIPDCERKGMWPKNVARLETIELPPHMRKVVSND